METAENDETWNWQQRNKNSITIHNAQYKIGGDEYKVMNDLDNYY